MNEQIQKAREDFLIECMRYVGLPYIWGGGDPRVGLDCSGLAQILLGKLHLDPPGDQTADSLMRIFMHPESEYTAINLHTNAGGYATPDLGDIIFFGKPERATHVAVMLNDSLMVEAGGGGRECTSPEEARKRHAQIRVSQANRRNDVICILRPKGLPWHANT